MHVRAVREVAIRPEVGVTERLEVRDSGRPEARLLRRREAEEELGSVRDEAGASDAGGKCHLLGQPHPAVETSAHEPPPNARDLEHAAEVIEQRLRTDRDVVENVASEDDGDVICLGDIDSGSLGSESRPRARVRASCVDADARRSSGRCRSASRNEALEVRKSQATVAPRPAGVELEALVEPPECVLELRTGLSRITGPLGHAHSGRDHLVMERRYEHLDAVVADHPDPVQKVLLSEARACRQPCRRCRQLVDQLVDTGCGESRRGGSAADELLAGQPHSRSGAAPVRACASFDRGAR